MYGQDTENRKAMPTAKLITLTYNINRSSKTQPITDLAPYLPYPVRYTTLMQLSLVSDVTQEAARDFARYQKRLPLRTKAQFEEWRVGLLAKANL